MTDKKGRPRLCEDAYPMHLRREFGNHSRSTNRQVRAVQERNFKSNGWRLDLQDMTDEQLRIELARRDLPPERKSVISCTLAGRASARKRKGTSERSQLSLFIPVELHTDARECARREGVSLSAFIRQAIVNEIEESNHADD